MSLYAIGDLHLSIGTDKPMDIFGGRWENYMDKIREGFSWLKDDDLTVVCGDISWGMGLEEAKEDFKLLDSFPGRKIILKGNHDYWWSTASKAYALFEAHGIKSIDILNNNCYFYGDTAICGTRGWFYEEETGTEHDKKIMSRELMRLETSLKCAGDREKYVFLHYPPKYASYECTEIFDLFMKYGVSRCYYGHIHGHGIKAAFEGNFKGVECRLVSADHIFFTPQKII